MKLKGTIILIYVNLTRKLERLKHRFATRSVFKIDLDLYSIIQTCITIFFHTARYLSDIT